VQVSHRKVSFLQSLHIHSAEPKVPLRLLLTAVAMADPKAMVDVVRFLRELPRLEFVNDYELCLQPRVLGVSQRIGWQGCKPMQAVSICLGGVVVKAFVMTSAIIQLAGSSKCSLTSTEFLHKAEKDLKVEAMAKIAKVRQFSTGSVGWHSHDTMAVKVGGQVLTVTCNFNVVIVGTKPSAGISQKGISQKGLVPPKPTHPQRRAQSTPPPTPHRRGHGRSQSSGVRAGAGHRR